MGKEHLPEYRDRNNFPYTMAMIQETIRLKTVGRLIEIIIRMKRFPGSIELIELIQRLDF